MPEQESCPSLAQCHKARATWPGCWHVAPGRALSLMPRVPSQLQLVRGQAWVTWVVGPANHSPEGPARERDVFLKAGQTLDIPAGAHLVMESLDRQASLDFDWRVLPEPVRERQADSPPSWVLMLAHWLLAWRLLGQSSVALARALWRSARDSAAQAFSLG